MSSSSTILLAIARSVLVDVLCFLHYGSRSTREFSQCWWCYTYRSTPFVTSTIRMLMNKASKTPQKENTQPTIF
ncbi:hypothetical protein KCU95_g75, partial [Aureobasidium melanogenum]